MLTLHEELQILNDAIAAIDMGSFEERSKRLGIIAHVASYAGHMCVRRKAAAWALENMKWKISTSDGGCEFRCIATDGPLELPSA